MPDLQRLFSELIRLEIELWNAADARLRVGHDLPLGRFEAMQIIARHGACRVQDIALAMVITVGGTSKLVDRLEAAGHCVRRANPDDRRSSLLELTPAGRDLLAEATLTFEDELARRLGAALPAAELDRLGATLSRLRVAGHELDTKPTERTA